MHWDHEPADRAVASWSAPVLWRFGRGVGWAWGEVSSAARSHSRAKAVENYRSPRRFAFAKAAGKSARTWSVPVHWRFPLARPGYHSATRLPAHLQDLTGRPSVLESALSYLECIATMQAQTAWSPGFSQSKRFEPPEAVSVQLKNGIRIKRRGAENSELRGGEAGEVPQRVSPDWSVTLCGSPRSQRLCVKVSQAST